MSYAHRHMLPRLQTMVYRNAVKDLETLELLAAGQPDSFLPTPCKCVSVGKACDFAYSAFSLRDPSSILFLRIGIENEEVRALVDSSSSRTFLGPRALDDEAVTDRGLPGVGEASHDRHQSDDASEGRGRIGPGEDPRSESVCRTYVSVALYFRREFFVGFWD